MIQMETKLIVADIGPKYYAPHHQAILEGLNAVNFELKPSRNDVEQILAHAIADFGTRQFLMKNLFWETNEQLAFRFNLPVLTKAIEEIGAALPFEKTFQKPTLFLRGAKSNYILEDDLDCSDFGSAAVLQRCTESCSIECNCSTCIIGNDAKQHTRQSCFA